VYYDSGDADAIPAEDQAAGEVQVLPAAGGVEGNGHPDEPHGHDDASPAPPRHRPTQDDAGTSLPAHRSAVLMSFNMKQFISDYAIYKENSECFISYNDKNHI